ncbi:uncharacterized protein LOC123268940 [Cotesia glomerata]|uniref:uncharacterized protein LOC123268940 n=1 Tax=Cotesia glomerata TaxID=32391 RepID=UPI001D0289F7|nr:uncharacterized protein LOC123268940 [Cotesia glomerata]
MPFYSNFLTMKVNETAGHLHTNFFKHQSEEEVHKKFDYYISESEWSSSNPSSPESPNLNMSLYRRKVQMSPPNSPLENSFMNMRWQNTPCKTQQICIGLKPSERISYLREILPLQNQSGGYTSRSKWELMAPLKAPLRRPKSSSSHLIW